MPLISPKDTNFYYIKPMNSNSARLLIKYCVFLYKFRDIIYLKNIFKEYLKNIHILNVNGAKFLISVPVFKKNLTTYFFYFFFLEIN